MAGALFQRQPKKQDHIISIDLGGRNTKAIYLQRKGERFEFHRFAIVDAPIFEKAPTADLLSEHLKQVVQALDVRHKQVILGIGINDSVLRQAEVPMMSISDLRLMLKLNSKNYLQQDLPDHVFDAYVLPSSFTPAAPGEKPKPAGMQKQKVIVGGAKRSLVEEYAHGARLAGLTATSIVPALLAPPNAFELANPEAFAKENVALVDLGFKHSSITILQQGEITLSRVVAGGGDKLTNGLSEALGISYGEAESIKVRLMSEVENNVEPLLSSLGRELRASIDFFEHQQDKPVTQVFVSGGSARSEFILKTLQNHLMIPCQSWNPTVFMDPALPPEQIGELEQIAPMLTVAVGMAATEF